MYFKSTPVLLLLLCVLSSASLGDDRILFSFESATAAKSWTAVNDGVMGGLSAGQFKINEKKNLEFYGTLSLRNNGGFASVRARGKNVALKKEEFIAIRVKGDGRNYNLNLYTRRDLGGYSYRQSFQTRQDEWIVLKLPVAGFEATWRGRKFPNEKLDPSAVEGLGILLGDKKAGPFKLEIEWIKAVSK